MWKWIRRRALTARCGRRRASAERPTSKPSGKTAKVPGECVGTLQLPVQSIRGHGRSHILAARRPSWLSAARFRAYPAGVVDEPGQRRGKSSCSGAWILAGRTATPNLLARTVTFERSIESLETQVLSVTIVGRRMCARVRCRMVTVSRRRNLRSRCRQPSVACRTASAIRWGVTAVRRGPPETTARMAPVSSSERRSARSRARAH